MNCPKCNAPMEPVTVEQYTVDRCAVCSGLWFDLREHEHIAHSKTDAKNLDTGDPDRGRRQDLKRDIACPFCHVKMLNISVPGQPHIHYESCPVCYGAYFDAGEFKDYATYSLPEQIKSFFRGFKRKQSKP